MMENYKIPMELLSANEYTLCTDEAALEKQMQPILQVLNDFKVKAEITSFTLGPSVTTFYLKLGNGISAKKIFALRGEFMLALGNTSVRVYNDLTKGEVCIETPSATRKMVTLGQTLRSVLAENCIQTGRGKGLTVSLGKDNKNETVTGNLGLMVHTLIGGSSGSGKSIFLNSIIIGLLYQNSPKDLQFLMIDPKQTELCAYAGLPHLINGKTITDFKETIKALDWAIYEMNRRYGLFEAASHEGCGYVMNMEEYNERKQNETEKLPKIIIVIDEFADLMMTSKKEMENRIMSLAQKARAAGIYLILTTQRAATDVVTGCIKANFPTRIAFSMGEEIASRVIVDCPGAEHLAGRGEYLYAKCGQPTGRMQAPYVPYSELKSVVDYVKTNYGEYATTVNFDERQENKTEENTEVEEVFIEALRVVIKSNSASISMIQRKCGVGYNKAGKIVEWMEENGFISPFDGAKPRKILITKEEFEEKFGAL